MGCRFRENEAPRDSQVEAAMTIQNGQQDNSAPAVADATQDATETMEKPCPADGCDSDRANYEMIPKPVRSYRVRLFNCVKCGQKWRES